MAVDYRLRTQWYKKQGRLPPEKIQDILTMLRRTGQQPGETEAEFQKRLDRQSAETQAEFDRRAREEKNTD
jgi:hypothetical protein